jgi:Mg2+/Co2+ transporter CorB
LDSIANGISWGVLVIAPIIGIVLFWLVHILPEKIAHKRKHPQTRLVQCLCLMSLVFGGILWPLAWILAYSKPVLHKLAYGTDVDESLAHDNHHGEAKAEETTEVEQLRARIAQLERQITGGQS